MQNVWILVILRPYMRLKIILEAVCFIKSQWAPKYSFHPQLRLVVKCGERISKHIHWVGNCLQCLSSLAFRGSTCKILITKVFSHFSNTHNAKFLPWKASTTQCIFSMPEYYQDQTHRLLKEDTSAVHDFSSANCFQPASLGAEVALKRIRRSMSVTHSSSHFTSAWSGARVYFLPVLQSSQRWSVPYQKDAQCLLDAVNPESFFHN